MHLDRESRNNNYILFSEGLIYILSLSVAYFLLYWGFVVLSFIFTTLALSRSLENLKENYSKKIKDKPSAYKEFFRKAMIQNTIEDFRCLRFPTFFGFNSELPARMEFFKFLMKQEIQFLKNIANYTKNKSFIKLQSVITLEIILCKFESSIEKTLTYNFRRVFGIRPVAVCDEIYNFILPFIDEIANSHQTPLNVKKSLILLRKEFYKKCFEPTKPEEKFIKSKYAYDYIFEELLASTSLIFFVETTLKHCIVPQKL